MSTASKVNQVSTSKSLNITKEVEEEIENENELDLALNFQPDQSH